MSPCRLRPLRQPQEGKCDGTHADSRTDGRAEALRHEGGLRRDHGTAIKRQHEPQRIVGDLLSRRDRREAGPLDQVPAHHRQAAAGQGRRGLRLHGTPINETWSGTWPAALRRPSAQCRPRRRHRDRQDASGHRDCPFACIRNGTRGDASTTSSISSTDWRRRPATASKVAWPST
jgi:hypothetical protein